MYLLPSELAWTARSGLSIRVLVSTASRTAYSSGGSNRASSRRSATSALICSAALSMVEGMPYSTAFRTSHRSRRPRYSSRRLLTVGVGWGTAAGSGAPSLGRVVEKPGEVARRSRGAGAHDAALPAAGAGRRTARLRRGPGRPGLTVSRVLQLTGPCLSVTGRTGDV